MVRKVLGEVLVWSIVALIAAYLALCFWADPSFLACVIFLGGWFWYAQHAEDALRKAVREERQRCYAHFAALRQEEE